MSSVYVYKYEQVNGDIVLPNNKRLPYGGLFLLFRCHHGSYPCQLSGFLDAKSKLPEQQGCSTMPAVEAWTP